GRIPTRREWAGHRAAHSASRAPRRAVWYPLRSPRRRLAAMGGILARQVVNCSLTFRCSHKKTTRSTEGRVVFSGEFAEEGLLNRGLPPTRHKHQSHGAYGGAGPHDWMLEVKWKVANH